MRILIVTDAWTPQVNGVVRTLQSVRTELERMGHEIVLISPDQFGSLPCPSYPEIRLAYASGRTMAQRIGAAAPDAIHIATEGPLGLAARRWCLRQGRPFTTAYHTQFPDYVAKRTGLPAAWFWRYIRWFHAPAHAVLVSTPTIARALNVHGLSRTRPWGRGVDLAAFRPGLPKHPSMCDLPGPVQLYVGRVAVEKNVDAFLASSHPGTKVVVGGGPFLAELQARFPKARFLGPLHGAELASAYAAADVFVFPSRTDTFGLVMIEALACGIPVAAYPVPGPIDVLQPDVGCIDSDLDTAIAQALLCDRNRCADYGATFTWAESARQFVAALAPLEMNRLAPEYLPQATCSPKSLPCFGRSVRGGPFFITGRDQWPSRSCPTRPRPGWSTIVR